MSTITNNGFYITVKNEFGELNDFRKTDIRYSCRNSTFVIRDNISGRNEVLEYADITVPNSSDIYDLRDIITGYITAGAP